MLQRTPVRGVLRATLVEDATPCFGAAVLKMITVRWYTEDAF
jgi:hypothetical protein